MLFKQNRRAKTISIIITTIEILIGIAVLAYGLMIIYLNNDVFASIGFMISFVVAYITVFRPLFRRPHLAMFIDKERCSPPILPDDTASWFIRLGITNYGISIANDCVGRLVGVWEKNGKQIEKFDPLTLYWARQDNEHTGFYPVKIHGFGDVMYLDIAKLKKNAITPLTFRVAHDLSFPNENNDSPSPGTEPVLKPGVYYVQIAIYAEGVSIPPQWFEIHVFDNIPECGGDAPYKITKKKPEFS